MSFASPSGEVDAEAIVVAFNRKGVRLALQMAVPGEDQTVGCQKSVQKVMWLA
jgi:hypothetical protein